jgi:hypothetical protein
MAKTHGDLLKAKQKRQKIIAAVGGVILLALLAVQVPKVMKHGQQSASPTSAAPATTPTPAAATTTETPVASTSQTAVSAGSSLATAPVKAADGKLTSFSRFASTDPFQQQIEDTAASDAEQAANAASSSAESGSAGGARSAGGSTSGAGGGGASAPSGGSGSSSPSSSGSGTSTKAVISVNGTLMSVATGAEFPQPSASDPGATPIFRLVSQTATSAKIAIVGGSYSTGATTITLRLNKPVTLMNTADGTRYNLVLEPRGTTVPKQG